MLKCQVVDEDVARLAGGDGWAERGEAGRLVRVHTHLRTSSFLSWRVPGGPGRKTRLTHKRSTRGVNSHGRQFRVDDSWDVPTVGSLSTRPWTGRIVFLVDKVHDDSWGTDQRRQRIEVGNLKESKLLRWFRLSESTNPDCAEVARRDHRRPSCERCSGTRSRRS